MHLNIFIEQDCFRHIQFVENHSIADEDDKTRYSNTKGQDDTTRRKLRPIVVTVDDVTFAKIRVIPV